jgi:putative ABC transport system ATP-binding protein
MGLRHLASDGRLGATATAVERPAASCRALHLAVGDRVLFDDLSLDVACGSAVAIMGPSGSGKTTLLHCLVGLRVPDGGEVEINGRPLSSLSRRERSVVRLHQVGMVFQFGELLPELSVLENVALPLRLRGSAVSSRPRELLRDLGLDDRATSFPGVLSGGEVQRVAIARALIGSPALVVADEPTGALDEQLSRVVCELLVEQAKRAGSGLVVVTHDPLVASYMDVTYVIRDGRLVTD